MIFNLKLIFIIINYYLSFFLFIYLSSINFYLQICFITLVFSFNSIELVFNFLLIVSFRRECSIFAFTITIDIPDFVLILLFIIDYFLPLFPYHLRPSPRRPFFHCLPIFILIGCTFYFSCPFSINLTF